jgi:RHS repeat-associated protein
LDWYWSTIGRFERTKSLICWFAFFTCVTAILAPGPARAEAPSNAGYIGFQGEWHNPDGTIHLRARTYHPRLRRFLQRDVYAGQFAATPSLNRYVFAENNPATWSDPSGYNTRKPDPEWIEDALKRLKELEPKRAPEFDHRFESPKPPPPCNVLCHLNRSGYDAYGNYVPSLAEAITNAIGAASSLVNANRGTSTTDCSFDADTAVATPEGDRPIASIRPGDEVYGKDPRTGVVAAFRVLATMATPDEEVVAVSVRSATGEIETVLTTPNHPFHVIGRGFVEAGALQKSDVVSTRMGAAIVASTRSVSRATMYNLDVDGFDTFLVGASQLLVHNECNKPRPKLRPKSLPDDAIVCRGGQCGADAFANGSGVTVGPDGKLDGVSVNSAAGKSLADLTRSIKNGKVGVTTVGEIRKAGGTVTPSPNNNNPDHATLTGLTPEQAEALFRGNLQPNPSHTPAPKTNTPAPKKKKK